MSEAINLTAKQQRFADEYLIDLNATAAYKRAGYVAEGNNAESAASRLLSNVKVATYIQAAMDSRAEKIGIDADYVLRTIYETVERSKQAFPVLNRKGEPVLTMVGDGDNQELVPAYTFDSGAVLKGAELLGKHLKLFTDKVEHTGKDGRPLDLSIKVNFVKPKEVSGAG